ncbi:MAG: hypothetical protein KatS3mg110_2731 [Pirellulaceae bacterium]|nr:MAG: hypothetical protein KatS3mg110_2731 [Pirellulaceae bacterium]
MSVLTLSERQDYERARYYITAISQSVVAEIVRLQQMLGSGTAVQEGYYGRSLMELKGLGGEVWKGIDARAYIDELRNEWDHR